DIERVDRLFVDRFWRTDGIGDLYKIDGWFELPDAGDYTWRPASLLDFGDDPEAYRFRFKNRGDEIRDDYAPLIELARLFDPSRTDDAGFDAAVETAVAADEWLRAIAVRTAADAWDTFGVLAGKNAYIYRPLPSAPFFYIPFDNDATFGIGPYDVRRPLVTSAMPEIRRFVTRPQFVRRYHAVFRELLDGPFSRDFLEPFFRENYDALRADGAATWPADVLAFLDARREFLASQLPEAEFRIVTNGGRPVETAADRISIIGDAPLEAARFHLNGEAVDPKFVSASRWTISLPLLPGENIFRFEAFDAEGRSIGEATAIVRSTRPATFIRGDANRDGRIDVGDGIAILAGLFSGGALPCPDAADVDDDGVLLIGDAVSLLQYLFAGGASPAPPFPDAGSDGTEDPLGCGA
ncbi:MAG: CotH kinase family protein, partial [Planctomycetes bacterium]|nr:CotH kinase family protein [Planctomycetota bacterium]